MSSHQKRIIEWCAKYYCGIMIMAIPLTIWFFSTGGYSWGIWTPFEALMFWVIWGVLSAPVITAGVIYFRWIHSLGSKSSEYPHNDTRYKS